VDPDFENLGFNENGDFIAPYQFDYALCKLDTPVEIDDTTAALVLNTDNEFPPPGTDTITIGFELIQLDPKVFPDTLQEVTIPTISNSNEICGKANLFDGAESRPGNICTCTTITHIVSILQKLFKSYQKILTSFSNLLS
jgi:hypothetical protein